MATQTGSPKWFATCNLFALSYDFDNQTSHFHVDCDQMGT